MVFSQKAEEDAGRHTSGEGLFRVRPGGSVQLAIRAHPLGTTPSCPEDYREAIDLIDHAWRLLDLRLPGRAYATGYRRADLDKYMRWLLGEEVARYTTKGSNGRLTDKPTWDLVLEYDRALRQQAAEHMLEDGDSWPAALLRAKDNNTLNMRYFLKPLALDIAVVPHRRQQHDDDRQPRGGARDKGTKGQGNGRDGGRERTPPRRERSQPRKPPMKGKKNGKRQRDSDKEDDPRKRQRGAADEDMTASKLESLKRLRTDLFTWRVDDKAVCFNFNRHKCTRGDKCNFLHSCGHCGGKHPAMDCNKLRRAMQR